MIMIIITSLIQKFSHLRETCVLYPTDHNKSKMKTLYKKLSTIPGTYQGQFIRFFLKKPISQPRSQVPLLFVPSIALGDE